jgi:hypothetical protein
MECFVARCGRKMMSSVLTVLMLNSVAKFGWVSYLSNVIRSSHITENTLHLLDKDSRLVLVRELLAVFMIITQETHKYILCVQDEDSESDS